MDAHDEPFLRQAIQLGRDARACGERPFGAVLVANGQIVAQAGDQCRALSDPTAHAELCVISSYCQTTGTFSSHRWRTDESHDTLPYTHHPYQYALSNPVLLTDPSGRDPWWTDPDVNRSPNDTTQDAERKQAECSEANYFNTISTKPNPNFQCGSFELEAQILPHAVSIAADLTPVVGIGKGVIEVFTGCDLITGDQLGYWRYAGLIPLFGKFRLLKELSIEVRAVGKLTTALRALDPELQALVREARALQQAAAQRAVQLGYNRMARPPAIAAVSDGGRALLIKSGADELTQDVLSRAERIGHTFVEEQRMAWLASHAEKKAYELRPNQPIGVTLSMCGDCRIYFIDLARNTGRAQIVADPYRVRIFNPDGSVAVVRRDNVVEVFSPNTPVEQLK